MNKQNNIEVPEISEEEFFDGLFRTDETWGDLWVRNHENCNECPFKERCDKLYKFFEAADIEVYCADLVNIMLGKKEIKDFL